MAYLSSKGDGQAVVCLLPSLEREVDVSNRLGWAFAALAGDAVTEQHLRYCRKHGHAIHSVNGVVQPRCPRCGELR